MTAPATAVVGTAFAVQDATTNQGTVTAAASATRYFLSLDTAKNGGDKLLGSRAVPMLPAGQTSPGPNVSVTIPSATAAGVYWLLACADDTALVGETSEINNCTPSPATVQVRGADVIETTVTFAVGSVAVGQTFTASDTVFNQGNARGL